MPATLHVPSKGALRTLRNIALGTTCTVAFAAGLLTEDRRRRISSLRKVHGNVQKIKASRSYHAEGKALIEALDDPASGPESIFLSGDPSTRNLIKDTNQALQLGEPISTNFIEPATSPPPFISIPAPRLKPPEVLWKPLPTIPTHAPINSPAPPQPCHPGVEIQDRQHRLVEDVTRLLGSGDSEADTEAAALRFFEAFEEGLSIDESNILPGLFDIAAQLSDACAKHSKKDYTEKILDIGLNHLPIDETQFHRLRPYSIIRCLIHQPKGKSLSDADVTAKLRKAYSIYVTQFEGKLRVVPEADLGRAQFVGEKLCSKAYHAKLYDLMEDTYSALPSKEKCSALTLTYLITAFHELRAYEQISQCFDLYSKTLPDEGNFDKTISLVVDSALMSGNGDIRLAESRLVTAAQMAVARGFSFCTTSILRVIGHQWRSTGNIHHTRELFGRLKSMVRVAAQPQAIYGAMIQFCVEAGEEAAAASYYEELREFYSLVPSDVRIYGHFALAKAMRNDWSGVNESLQGMAIFNPYNNSDFSRCFTPILKLFAKSHSISETEDFVRGFIEKGHLQLTVFISNKMIDTYAKAREIGSLVRWVEYAATVGCKFNAVSVNIILNHCYRTWKFPFEQTYRLYRRLLSLGNGSQPLMDTDTIDILRRIAVNNSTSAQECSNRLRLLKDLGRQKLSFDSAGVHRAMKTALALDNPNETLKIYHRARGEDILLRSEHVVAAVRASLQINENADEAIRLINNARLDGMKVEFPISILVVHQMTKMCEQDQSGDLLRLVQHTMSTLEGYGLSASPAALTHAINILERRGRFREALSFWRTISEGQRIPRSSIDLPMLSVLLRVFIGLCDARGIIWVEQVLVENRLVPDVRFCLDVKRAHKVAIGLEDWKYCRTHPEFTASIGRLHETVVDRRNSGKVENWKVGEMAIKLMERAISDRAATINQRRDGPITPQKTRKTTPVDSFPGLGEFSKSGGG